MNIKSILALLLGIFLILSSPAWAAEFLPLPSGVGTSGQLLAVTSDNNNAQGTSTPSVTTLTATGAVTGSTGVFTTSTTVGSGTAVTKITIGTVTVTSHQMAARTCVEKAYSLSGLTTSDKVFVNPAYAMDTEEAPIVGARVAAADNVELTFCNVSNVSVDPETGTVNVVAIRS